MTNRVYPGGKPIGRCVSFVMAFGYFKMHIRCKRLGVAVKSIQLVSIDLIFVLAYATTAISIFEALL